VADSTTATITASYAGMTKTAILTVAPPALSSLSLAPTSITGGSSSQGTVTLTGPAPTGGASVSLSSNSTAAVVPATVTVVAGSTTATFTITTTAVSSSTTATITASYQGASKTATLTVTTAATAVAVDVTVYKDSSSSSSTITTPSFKTASANELLLAFITAPTPPIYGTPNSYVNSVTNSGQALTWTLVQRTNTQYGTAEIWRAFATTALSAVTVTATLNQNNPTASITVVAFTGTDATGTNGSGAIGAVASANSLAGAPSATLVTTRANSLVYGVGNDWDGPNARTVGSNQTMVHQYLAPTGDTYWVQRQTNAIPEAGTTVVINDTAPTDHRYNLSIVEIRTQ
jgi:hypothetical protein